jgi:anti-anti-sigma factor
MASSPKLFEISQQDDIVIVTAMRDLSEFVYEALESEAVDVLALLKDGHCRSVVVDLSPTDYCGSTALGLFLKIWKQTRANNGKMSFCGLSANEHEVFATMKLDSLWPLCDTLDEAMEAVRG